MPHTRPHPARLRELLLFYAEAGVDETLVEEAQNRFAAPDERTPPIREARDSVMVKKESPRRDGSTIPRSVGSRAILPDAEQVASARNLAQQAKSPNELKAILAEFDGCDLKYMAKNLVFADGNPEAPLMLVGEAPGREEDLQGLPFVGRSGQLLNRILAAIGRDRTNTYITNIVPWRPPGNRDPSPREAEICRPFIERHIDLIQPKVLVTLGNPSTKLLLNTQTGIMRMRGIWAIYTTKKGMEIPTLPTLHPAYLLRNPAHKKLAWLDFLTIKSKLQELGDQNDPGQHHAEDAWRPE